MSRKITEADVKRTVKFWTAALKLDHWKVKLIIGEELETKTRQAEIGLAVDYCRAEITLGPEWNTWTIAELEEIIIHELLHIHLHQIHCASLEGPDRMGEEAFNLYEKRVLHELEAATEGLAQVIVDIAWS